MNNRIKAAVQLESTCATQIASMTLILMM